MTDTTPIGLTFDTRNTGINCCDDIPRCYNNNTQPQFSETEHTTDMRGEAARLSWQTRTVMAGG